MRKIIGIGETILDIIFKNNQPSCAVPGGSAFNAILSLRRLGAEVCYLSELGDDKVGDYIRRYMEQNGIPTSHLGYFAQGKSPLSLAFLDEQNNADYAFYTNYDNNKFDVLWPQINHDDIVLIGSYYALNPQLHDRLLELLSYACDMGAIIYYDPNFRSSHLHEVVKLMPSVIDNLEFADIVRGSDEDFANLFALDQAERVYHDKVKFYCSNMICTRGAAGVELYTHHHSAHFPTPKVEAVSTIGAGDNFNAGLLYGLLKYNVTHEMLDHLSPQQWEQLIACGIACATEVVQSYDNSVSVAFCEKIQQLH